jgi:hypothetical protein
MLQRPNATVKVTGYIGDPDDGPPYPLKLDLSVSVPLRDLFAAFALAGILAKSHGEEGLDAEVVGADACYFADVSLAARGEKPSAQGM